MRFEKLNENKIRITFNIQDLQDKQIDFHAFMANSIETQDLFLDMLEEAEKELKFSTKNYKVKIEALAMADGDFIVTVTRLLPTTDQIKKVAIPKKILKVHRRKPETNSSQIIYKFDTFDDYYYFIEFLNKFNLTNSVTISKQIVLYLFKNHYYLVLNNINLEHKSLLKFSSSIAEFATYVSNSELFVSKLIECGKIIIKNNALKTSLKHFKYQK